MNNKRIRMTVDISFNLIVLVIGIIIVCTAGSKAYSFGHNIFYEEAVSTEESAREVEVTIKDGITEKQLSKLLYSNGLVKDEFICYLQIKLSDYKGKFVAGTYTLDTSMKPTQMMLILCNMTLEDE